jgi:beta-lactam-binding protein with PASTA domain
VVSCVVPSVVGQQLASAKRLIVKWHCATGKIKSAYSRRQKGRVISQSPRAGRELAAGTPIRLVVSKGRKPR